jgi:Cu2+-exporting ATPase
MQADACFHCGETLAGREILRLRIRDAEVGVCCAGCRAAAAFIANLGLEDFYSLRTAPSARPASPDTVWLPFDAPELRDRITRREAHGRSVVLLVDGLTCAACGWLVSHALLKMDGVLRASVNTATGRARVAWDDDKLRLSEVLAAIAALGYRPQPVDAAAAIAHADAERHAILKRLAVAGLGMMQAMMFAVAMYSGDLNGMDGGVRSYLRLVSLLVTTPVMLYGGWPFFRGAARALGAREITMDVPVSLGLILAYGASLLNTWRHAGEVYFDSITMFIFFLTVARYVEMIARHQCTSVSDALSRVLPATAHRFDGTTLTDIGVGALRIGDQVLVRPGEIVPADGTLCAGRTRIDESLLTGERLPLARGPGSVLAGGTLNVDAPIEMRVTAVGDATVLSHVVALLQRALADKPRLTRAADRMASRFLGRVLIGATLVFLAWSWFDPSRAFPATLAVLVVACPCALSLATLVAVASANTALARRGVLVTHADAVESLAKATVVMFDKTGTLTSGAIRLAACSTLGDRSAADCLALAAALEAGSEHPIARAFQASVLPAGSELPPGRALPSATERTRAGGAGVAGVIAGERYRIGTRAFVTAAFAAAGAAACGDDERIYLGDERGMLAAFALGDALREDSAAAAARLRAAGFELEISSGDAAPAVARVAALCGIERCAARQAPRDKLARVRTLGASGEFVAMVGDGINDAPVLAGAGVSIAMGRGSALAQASADLILVGDSLEALPDAFAIARRARVIIKQNLVWAAGYNLTAMPLAAFGLVPPWLAAIGMSASSIFVVLNSLRLLRRGIPPDSAGAASHSHWSRPSWASYSS